MEKIPRHVGIILDGNRRFAKKKSLNPFSGHEEGAKTVENLLEWASDLGIKEMTLYTLSSENFNRQEKEVNFLFRLFEKKFEEFYNDKRIDEKRIRIRFIGRLHLFPKKLQDMMNNLMEKTKDYDNYFLNFAMGYGGRTEIVDAMKKIAEKVRNNELMVENINEDTICQNLYLQDEPDLIIRTSEQRLSNFLTWQCVYSEILFLPDKLWPEFTKEDLIACLDEYSRRKRRFGK